MLKNIRYNFRIIQGFVKKNSRRFQGFQGTKKIQGKFKIRDF